MNNINQYIEYTNLKPTATQEDIINLYAQAVSNKYKGICAHIQYIKYLYESGMYNADDNIQLITVVDFPFGMNTTLDRLKIIENNYNIADDFDIVIPLHHVANNNYSRILADIKEVKSLIPNKILKVIIENSLWTKQQVIDISSICAEAGADYIKTSTGFINTRPTGVEDIQNIKIGLQDFPEVKIKASAGIKTVQQALDVIEHGASCIGTSGII